DASHRRQRAGAPLLHEEARQLRLAARCGAARPAVADQALGHQPGAGRLAQASHARAGQERRLPHAPRRTPVSSPFSAPLGSTLLPLPFHNRRAVNRRAFLRAGAVAIGLPFLEGLPERSAWAQNSPPVFGLFIVAACGVVGSKFFPGSTGPLTSSGLGAMTDKATSVLAPHAEQLLFLKGVNF